MSNTVANREAISYMTFTGYWNFLSDSSKTTVYGLVVAIPKQVPILDAENLKIPYVC